MTMSAVSVSGSEGGSQLRQPRVYMGVLLALGLSHLLNDTIQSLIPAVYPILKDEFLLDFAQIGIITLTFQIAGALFQPAIGLYTDRHPLPYSGAVAMVFSLAGIVTLAYATSYALILVAVTLIGIGSSIFHPEATRSARYASGGRQGLAQGIFQVGGQTGGALGPLAAAIIIVPMGQSSLSWFAGMAILAMVLLAWTAGKQAVISRQFLAATAAAGSTQGGRAHARRTVVFGLAILMIILFSKVSYLESLRSFYTFYLIDRFGVSIAQSQMMLFLVFVASAVGVFIGGMLGDRIGRYRIIWLSVLGPLPFTILLPYADLFWTGVLTVIINLIMASAFASIMIYAMELVPHRIGLIGGLFYGLSFAFGGIAAAILGGLTDRLGLETVYVLCSFLPAAGLLTWFLPKLRR